MNNGTILIINIIYIINIELFRQFSMRDEKGIVFVLYNFFFCQEVAKIEKFCPS